MAASKTKPTDVTGRQREKLIKENAEELARRSEEMSIATAVDNVRKETEVTDLSVNPALPTIIDDVEDLGVTTADDATIIRVAEDLDFVTIGVGQHFSFKAGQKYKVAKHVAEHLREKGYLYERA